jgi:hypothetical protein
MFGEKLTHVMSLAADAFTNKQLLDLFSYYYFDCFDHHDDDDDDAGCW